jgi:hypothetical protein
MDAGQWLGLVGSAVGRGLLAGLVGIAVMTLSQIVEMRLSGREPSTSPGDAAAKVLRIRLHTKEERGRFANVVHWLYGTAWGAVRGILGLFGAGGWMAIVLHFALVWGIALMILPGLKVVPPVREWGVKSIIVDAFHHAVYAAAVGLTYQWITLA